jgi:hypothetical protein
MYVFLSPSALESKWVPFESGYAYSREIRVVPVGILGVDLATIGPPLGLLQGFNISSGPGMNNLIKVALLEVVWVNLGRFKALVACT